MVYDAATKRLEALPKKEGAYALTSFRRAGCNDKHGKLHETRDILQKEHGKTYVHFQSGHENTLFGFGESDEDFAIKASAGMRSCKTQEETEEYMALEMPVNWYIEWLAVFDWLATRGGVLVLYDLSGDAEMATSPNW